MVAMRVVGVATACLVAGACINNMVELDDAGDSDGESSSTASVPTGGFDDGRATVTGTPTTTAPVPPPPMTADATVTGPSDTGWWPGIDDGWWLLALDTGQPGLPFQFIVFAAETSPGVWDLMFQSLALDVGSTTTPRYPVGDPTLFEGIALGNGAPLQFATGRMTIPGPANPINGSEVTIDAVFDGMEIGDPYCGSVTGWVIAPIEADLAGSTFATTRIEEPGLLPEIFPTTCP